MCFFSIFACEGASNGGSAIRKGTRLGHPIFSQTREKCAAKSNYGGSPRTTDKKYRLPRLCMTLDFGLWTLELTKVIDHPLSILIVLSEKGVSFVKSNRRENKRRFIASRSARKLFTASFRLWLFLPSKV